jgi:hypothetical protein
MINTIACQPTHPNEMRSKQEAARAAGEEHRQTTPDTQARSGPGRSAAGREPWQAGARGRARTGAGARQARVAQTGAHDERSGETSRNAPDIRRSRQEARRTQAAADKKRDGQKGGRARSTTDASRGRRETRWAKARQARAAADDKRPAEIRLAEITSGAAARQARNTPSRLKAHQGHGTQRQAAEAREGQAATAKPTHEPTPRPHSPGPPGPPPPGPRPVSPEQQATEP